MTSPEPLVRFYDLSGPKTWSPTCWATRYALNYKGIPYVTVKLSYPDIKPTCEKLFPDMTGLVATVPIIEALGPDYKPLNDSTPIAMLLNERFTEEMGYKHLKDVEKLAGYTSPPNMAIPHWILNDVYENSLDPHDGSKEYFKSTREARWKCELKDFMQVRGGGEEAVWEELKVEWAKLRERMNHDDGQGEPTYLDFKDASNMKWIEAASPEKYQKLLGLYGDDTFTKLMKKVEKYESLM